MTKYKNIEKYMGELNMFPINMKDDLTFSDHGIKASDLEAILAKGVEVYGNENSYDIGSAARLSDMKISPHTHSGLLIGYKPMLKETSVSKSEIIAALGNNELTERIKKYGFSND